MNRTEVLRDYREYIEAGRDLGLISVDRIARIRLRRPSPDVLDRYLQLPDLTSTVSDLLDAHGIHGAVAASHLRPLNPGHRVVGCAVTLRSLPERKTPTRAALDGDPIRMVTRVVYRLAEPGDVLVADFAGDLNVSNLGGESVRLAKEAGLAGAVVHGAVRDVDSIRASGFPLWAAGATPITGKYRLETTEVNGPVRLHDIVVQPADLVVADDSGVCIVPQPMIETLLREAESQRRG